MITWMQRHKKWLVVTLWISVIAFVGAGFVGWGSYDYSKSNSTVAKVGSIEVSMTDVQNEYSSLYGQYQSVYKDKFNAETAKKLGLEQMAMGRAIQNAKLLSFANELGMLTTDKEVAKNLIETPQFQKDGKFDKTMYIKALAQNRLNPKDYERNLKKSILLSKTAKIFQSNVNESEVQLLNSLFEVQDDVEIYIIDTKNIASKSDETSMKKFWETNKEKYKSKATFQFDSYKVALVDKKYSKSKIKDFYTNNKNLFRDSAGKVKKFDDIQADIIKNLKIKSTKKEALRKYIDLKKSKIKFSSKENYDIDVLPFDINDITKIKSAKIGKVLKPIKMIDGSYIVLKLTAKSEPKALSYNDAKIPMENDYQNYLKKQLLQTNSKIALTQLNQNNLKTTKLGYVSRSSTDKLKNIKGLNDTDGIEFLNGLFASNSESGIITLRYSTTPKAIVYKIKNQKLGTQKSIDDKSNQMLRNAIKGIKDELIFANLIKNLENRYETQVFRK